MPINRDAIMAVLPHREPMLLVDEIIEIEPGIRAVGLKHVTLQEFWVPGHYPDFPILPGVLILEAMAQTGGVALLSSPDLKDLVPLLVGIEKARLRRQVRPGDTLRMEVEITRLRRRIGRGQGRAYVGEEPAAEAEIIFALVARDHMG